MVKMSRRTFIRSMAVGTGSIALLSTKLTVHAAGPEAYKLRIIHTNDHHAHIEPVMNGKDIVHGGVSRRKTMIDAIRDEGGNQLLIDAGDVFQGTLYFNQYQGQADLEFYNAMKYEAVAVGNHEFDIGQPPLAAFIKNAQFPMLSANIVADSSSPLAGLIKPWIVKEIGGQKIGIFGLTTEETAILSNPGPGVTFGDPYEAAARAVAELRSQGVSKIIALTHIGITADRELARRVDGISVIIGGHSHTPMGPMLSEPDPSRPYPEVLASPSGQTVVMATDWEWGRWLGDLTIGFDADGMISSVVAARPAEVAPSIKPDPSFEVRIADLSAPLAELRARVVGEAAVVLNGERADVRSKETNLGNLISDSMLAKTASDGSQIAIMNGGGIRTSIPAGQVTVGEIIEVQPFGNTIVLLTLSGAQVKEALENGVSQVESGAGRFPQVGGMRYSFDPAAAPGSRVTGVQVKSGGGYVALDPAAKYRTVVNNFIAGGGDGYSVLKEGTDKIDTGFLDSDVMIEYIQAKSPVNIQTEGRIVASGTLEGAAPAPQLPGQPAPQPPATLPNTGTLPIPATLPNTGAEWTPGWILAALGASAISGGMALRSRGKRAVREAVEAEEQELVEVE